MKRFFLFFTLLLLIACRPYRTTTLTLPDGFKVHVKIADTPEKQTRGLMFVKHLPENQGMLFAFENETEQLFWMKNTLIDLDIIFIGADKRVILVDPQVPHSYTYTPDDQVAQSAGFGKYVLEVPAKTAQRHGITSGAQLHFTL